MDEEGPQDPKDKSSKESLTQQQGKHKTRVVSYNSPDHSLERYLYDGSPYMLKMYCSNPSISICINLEQC